MFPIMVRITWREAGHLDGWQDLVAIENWSSHDDDFIVNTTGYMVKDTEDFIVVAPCYIKSAAKVFSAVRIPQTAIIGMEVIHGT